MKYKTQNPNAIKNPTKWIFYACMVALPLTHFAIFYIYVNFNSILMAFQTYDKATGSFVFGNNDQFVSRKPVMLAILAQKLKIVGVWHEMP